MHELAVVLVLLVLLVVLISVYLIRPDLIVVLWYNGSWLAILLNGIEVSETQAITK